jgi:hypothetical protein
MRRILYLLGLAVALLAIAAPDGTRNCGPTNVKVEILEQPQGGQNVNTLTCKFNGVYTYTDEKPFELEAVWMTDSGPHKTETFTFTKDSDVQTLTTSFSAPEGMFLDKTFWVKFPNSYNQTESNKAICTVQ